MGIMTSSDFAALVAALVARTDAPPAEVWASLHRPRPCTWCRRIYTPYAEASFQHLYGPHWYLDGLARSCAACWLGVGPRDIDGIGGDLD